MRLLFLSCLLIFSFLLSAQKPGRSVDVTRLHQTVDSIITSLMKDRKVPGVVFTMVNNGNIYKKAYGLADIERNLPMNADKSLIRIGSVNL